MSVATAPYPFSAIVGADQLKLALLLNAVQPAIGGVLVRGEKGTAKSTAVRALADQLPDITVVAGCRFRCDPASPDPTCPDGPHTSRGDAEPGSASTTPTRGDAEPGSASTTPTRGDAEPGSAGVEALTRPARLVELPVGASEDRLAGSLDLERALVEGTRAFEPGLLALAHRGVLYVDEVNLLGDHLVDLLLDAAAMGVNIVEREGVSVRHAARFQLVGTMNPEEGELRPQLLDRFGLTVEIAASRDPHDRAEVVRRRLAYEADPDGFAAQWRAADADVAWRIRAARALLPRVELGDDAVRAVVAACTAFDVDGMRADIVTAKTARALAAWNDRTHVTVDDVRTAALLALPHRRRRGPFESPGLDEDFLDKALESLDDEPEPDPPPPDGDPEPPDGDGPAKGGAPPPPPPGNRPPPDGPGGPGEPSPDPTSAPRPPESVDDAGDASDQAGTPPAGASAPTVLPVGATFDPVLLTVEGVGAGAAGRRSPAESDRGRHAGDRRPDGTVRDVALGATLRAAAPHQRARRGGEPGGPGLLLRHGDLREKVRVGREGNLVLFVVDASGSMATRRRMSAVKAAVLSLLLDAYQRRDRVGLITFRRDTAEVVLPPTGSVERAVDLLADLPTGGRTPIAAGLERTARVLDAERVRDPRRRPLVVLMTDGRATGTRGVDAVTQAERAARGLATRRAATLVIDTEDAVVRLGLAGRLADALDAPWIRLEQLSGGQLAGLIRTVTTRGGTRRTTRSVA